MHKKRKKKKDESFDAIMQQHTEYLIKSSKLNKVS